jgi:Protein of unknown function (DUF1150)
MLRLPELLQAVNQAAVAGNTAHVAYIRPVPDGEKGYAVCSADGKQLAVFPTYDAAFFTAREYNLTPVNVH